MPSFVMKNYDLTTDTDCINFKCTFVFNSKQSTLNYC